MPEVDVHGPIDTTVIEFSPGATIPYENSDPESSDQPVE